MLSARPEFIDTNLWMASSSQPRSMHIWMPFLEDDPRLAGVQVAAGESETAPSADVQDLFRCVEHLASGSEYWNRLGWAYPLRRHRVGDPRGLLPSQMVLGREWIELPTTWVSTISE
jgi:hypothetical protein